MSRDRLPGTQPRVEPPANKVQARLAGKTALTMMNETDSELENSESVIRERPSLQSEQMSTSGPAVPSWSY